MDGSEIVLTCLCCTIPALLASIYVVRQKTLKLRAQIESGRIISRSSSRELLFNGDGMSRSSSANVGLNQVAPDNVGDFNGYRLSGRMESVATSVTKSIDGAMDMIMMPVERFTPQEILMTPKEILMPPFMSFSLDVDFCVERRLTRSGVKSIYLGRARHPRLAKDCDGHTFIVKITVDDTENAQQKFELEIGILWLLVGHPNIIKMVGYCQDPRMILTKHCNKGSLARWISRRSLKQRSHRYSLLVAIKLIKDIAYGLSIMHENNLAHCNIHPAHILVDKDEVGTLSCVITDFGSARIRSKDDSVLYSLPKVPRLFIPYTAPELLTRKRTKLTFEECQAGDIYGMSMLAFMLMDLRFPYEVGFNKWER